MPFRDSHGAYHAFQSSIQISLNDFRECNSSGDVGAIVANGGILASDTTPILEGDTNEVQRINWATGNVDPLTAQFALPNDFDGGQDVTLDLWVASGTTNLFSMTVETSWDGAALVSDSAVDPAQSATIHKITATISAADIPDGASFVTIALTPTAAHATDAYFLYAARLNYVAKTF